MSDFLKKFLLEDPRRLNSSGRYVALAAFGKHPGWDDHVEDLGLETESLNFAKTILYVNGIGGQIDSGAWEKLDPAQQLPGFKHIFVWQRSGQILIGRLWSSSDGKGRTRYPMVVCLHFAGVTLGWALKQALPVLAELEEGCLRATSADEVRSLLNRARAALRKAIQSTDGRGEYAPVTPEALHKILHPAEVAKAEGFLRVLYQIQSQLGAFAVGKANARGSAVASRAQQIRVPAVGQNPEQALLFWTRFFLRQVDASVPLLLTLPLEAGWVDVTVGEPESHEFFCLRASPRAVPMVSEVPYTLDDPFRAEAKAFLASFERGDTAAANLQPAPTPTVAAPAPAKGAWRKWLGGGAVLVVGAVAVMVLLPKRGQQQANAARPAEAPPSNSLVKAEPGKPKTGEYDAAVKAARDAIGKENYDEAERQANMALVDRPADAAAKELLTRAQEGRRNMDNYTKALKLGTEAFGKENYDEAERQATAALAARPSDAPAKGLLTRAQEGKLNLANYSSALKAGMDALGKENYDEAERQANSALVARPADATAKELATKALEGRRMKESYDRALKAAKDSLAKQDYDGAARQANVALGSRPGDATAKALLASAQEAKRSLESSAAAANATDPKPPPVVTPFAAPVGSQMTNSIGMVLVKVPSGILVGKYEVTQAEYRKVMAANPSKSVSDRQPVEQVSWNDANEFCSKLTDLERGNLPPANRYALPTEKQWVDFAAGQKFRDIDIPGGVLTRKGHPSEVGQPATSNRFGLFDVLGNVWEWCLDETSEGKKVIRGGAFDSANDRQTLPPDAREPNCGFRCILAAP